MSWFEFFEKISTSKTKGLSSRLTRSYNRVIRVGMKNVVVCYKEFFGYFDALKTKGDYNDLEKSISIK